MTEAEEDQIMSSRRVGRPRRGTEGARVEGLMSAATRVFLRDGYGQASMDKVAAEAGVSTRTIYERYKNKADLLGAVIGRLLDRMATVPATADLDRLDPAAALKVIAHELMSRARDPDSAALFRIVATEAVRFPELAARMLESDKHTLDRAVAEYLRRQIKRGALQLSDPERAASLFLQMMFGELHECWLFGGEDAVAKFDIPTHVDYVVELFLKGATPRSAA